jgi:IS1 family transposase/transposase-like protein
MVTIQIACRHCGSENIIRNGMTSNSKQRFLQGLRQELPRESPTQRLHRRKVREILRAYQERSSLRGLSRTFGVSPNTVTSWLESPGAPRAERNACRAGPRRSGGHYPGTGRVVVVRPQKAQKRWVWLALCRQTRQVVAYYIGDRSEESCRKLWERVPETYQGGHCYSDFWKAYREVIPAEQHTEAGKESGETAHVERWNNTLRQRLSRFVRKSLSFSKSDRMHEICLRLFLHRYNLSHLP